MNNEKIKVGDKLYQKRQRRAFPRGTEIVEHTVTKVGRLYFYTDKGEELRFLISRLRDDNYGTRIYRSKEEIEQEVRHNKLRNKIAEVMPGKTYDLTYDQLTQIAKIIGLPTEPPASSSPS